MRAGITKSSRRAGREDHIWADKMLQTKMSTKITSHRHNSEFRPGRQDWKSICNIQQQLLIGNLKSTTSMSALNQCAASQVEGLLYSGAAGLVWRVLPASGTCGRLAEIIPASHIWPGSLPPSGVAPSVAGPRSPARPRSPVAPPAAGRGPGAALHGWGAPTI
jgi:hypothetical protein